MPALDTVRDAELFAGLAPEQQRAVAAIAGEWNVAAGGALFQVGERADDFYVIQRGRVELTFPLTVMGETRETRFQTLEAGRTLAWSALVPPHRLTMSARAATDLALLRFQRDRVHALFDAQPAVGRVVMTNLARVVATRLHELLALWVREVQRNVSQTYR